MGTNIVVQGGTFNNNAILRCFELLTGKMLSVRILQVLWVRSVRHLSQKNVGTAVNVIFFVDELDSFTFDTSLTRCQKCNNHCQLTITKFSDGSQFVSVTVVNAVPDLKKTKSKCLIFMIINTNVHLHTSR